MEKINYIGLSGEFLTVTKDEAAYETLKRTNELRETLERAKAQIDSLQSLVLARGLKAWAEILADDALTIQDQINSLG